MRTLALLAALGTLAACATVPADGDPPVREIEGSCRAEPGQRFIGTRAERCSQNKGLHHPSPITASASRSTFQLG